MKKPKYYVVQCIKPVSASKVGLGQGRFKVGDYVSEDGPPCNFDEAAVYLFAGLDFPFDEVVGPKHELFSEYFEKVPLEIKRVRG